jgi:GWxTD domain-containing protein
VSDRLLVSAVLALCCVTHACAPWRTDPDVDRGRGNPGTARVYDPTQAYQSLGLLATGEPVPFSGSVRFLAGAEPESTFVMLGLSLASSALSFRRVGSHFEAGYRVEAQWLRDGNALAAASEYETVRVATFSETRRQDESIVFQRYFRLAPGAAALTVVVTDLYGSDSTRAEQRLEVPEYGMGSAGLAIVPAYRVKARTSRAQTPELVMNPRAYVTYGTDTLRFYIESYGRPAADIGRLKAFTSAGAELWRDTVELDRAEDLAAGVAYLPADRLTAGAMWVEAELGMGLPGLRVNGLVGLSSGWPVADFEDILSLLRYFGDPDGRRRVREAGPSEQPRQWRDFWQATDPDSATAANEALRTYLEEVEVASARFQEAGIPGWLTERGEVFLVLGRPDAIREVEQQETPGGQRLIRWDYVADGLALYFVRERGRGNFRLTPTSRVEYVDAVRRRRATGGA